MLLERRLLDALAELNPDLPSATLDNVLRELTHPEGPTLEAPNREFHRMLIYGVTVEYWASDGNVSGVPAQVVDFDNPSNNDWLAVNQFSVTENPNTRRPDVMLFVNGLPPGIIELKNPVDEDATLCTAWNQLQTYKSELSALFSMNESMVVSDGMEVRIGALTAGREWFKPRRTIGGENTRRWWLDRTPGHADGSLRPPPVPLHGPRFHRIRGRRQRQTSQEDGRLPSVSRRSGGRGRNPAPRLHPAHTGVAGAV